MALSLEWGDFLALGGYFVVIIGIGVWSSCQNRGSVDGYFLARRTMNFVPVSLFKMNKSSFEWIFELNLAY